MSSKRSSKPNKFDEQEAHVASSDATFKKKGFDEDYKRKQDEETKIDTQQIARNVAQQKLMEIASKAKEQMKAKTVKATAQA